MIYVTTRKGKTESRKIKHECHWAILFSRFYNASHIFQFGSTIFSAPERPQSRMRLCGSCVKFFTGEQWSGNNREFGPCYYTS